MDKKKLPLALIVENRAGFRLGILLIAALFLLTFLPWLGTEREMLRQEGFFAAIASEYIENGRILKDGIAATAHHQIVEDAYPLYPTAVSLLSRCGVPMESALRIISVLMLGVLSLLAGIAAASRSNFRAGAVAACCCMGTLLALDNAVVGGPETMAACFLFSAQLLFFHYGSRLADWNSAWISAAILVSLGFLTAGPVVVLFFAVPLVFLRRPLSSAEKFRTPGFIAGAVLLVLVVASWALPIGLALRQYAVESGFTVVPLKNYLFDLLLFPVKLPWLLLPWTLVMWLPFCMALQAVSPLPVLGLYSRTLVVAMTALAWLLPENNDALLFYLIAPLAVQTGLYYELGVRRYGIKLRKMLSAASVFFPVAGVCVLIIYFLPEKFEKYLPLVSELPFGRMPDRILGALAALGFFTVLAILFNAGLRKFPFWINVVILNLGISAAAMVLVLPYQAEKAECRKFGNDIRAILPSNAGKIYKYDIQGMYNGLFYTGKPVYKLRKDERLPEKKGHVYLISTGYPDVAGWSWQPLLPSDYNYRGVTVALWEGTPVPADDEFGGQDE